MKHIKKFESFTELNESVLDDIRKHTDAAVGGIKRSLHGSKVFCPECGEPNEKSDKFCYDCGVEISGSSNDSQTSAIGAKACQIKGKLEKIDSPSKTPQFVLRSTNKTIDGTKVLPGKVDWMEISKYVGKEVTISGMCGDSPSFKSPINVDKIS
jgi:hypothetical protein